MEYLMPSLVLESRGTSRVPVRGSGLWVTGWLQTGMQAHSYGLSGYQSPRKHELMGGSGWLFIFKKERRDVVTCHQNKTTGQEPPGTWHDSVINVMPRVYL